MRITALILALTGLSACTGMEITQPPVDVVARNPGSAAGLDVYAKARAQGQQVPRYRGENFVPVRSYTKAGSNGRTEVAGANCAISNALYTAKVTTPVMIQVPNYGPQSPAINAQCSLGGASGTSSAAVYNESSVRRQNAGAANGILGAVIAIGVDAALTNPEKDTFLYRQLDVVME